MRKFKKILFILGVGLIIIAYPSSIIATNDSVGMTLSTAVEMAISNNHELRMAHEDVEIADQNYNEVRGQLFPQINLNASYSLTNNRLPSSVIPSSTVSNMLDDPASDNEKLIAAILDRSIPSNRNREEAALAGQLALSQPIFLGGQLFHGLRVLDRVRTLQEKRFELEMQNMVVTVVNAYYDLYLAQEGLAIQREALSNAEQHSERVTNLFSQGLVSEFDKLRAELEVSRLYPEVLSYENLENLAQENFNRITGYSGDVYLNPILEEKALDFSRFEISLEESLASADENRIELYLINLMADIYAVQFDAEKINFAPNLLFQADITQYASKTGSYSIQGDDFGTMGSVGLVFQMPIFTGLSNTSKRLRAKHELRRAEYDVLNTTELIHLEVRQTWQSFNTSKRYLEVQVLNLNLAERALVIAEARYENQAGIQLEVFDAQVQYNAAQISLAQARIRIIKDFYALQKALGNNLNTMIGDL